MKKLNVFLLATLLILSFQGSAVALSLSVFDDIADDTYINNGQTIYGSFDINPQIPNNGDYNIPYDVDSASATFKFTDDGDSYYTSRSTGDYFYNFTSGNTRYFARYQYDYFYDSQRDSVWLNLEGQISYDGTDWQQIQVYDGSTFDGYSYYPPYYYAYYTWNYDNTQGYFGDLTLTQVFGPSALASLSDDGIVNFSLTAYSSDIIYNWGQMDAVINTNPADPVPEPATILLLGAGLAGLAGFRRKKKSKRLLTS